MSLKNYAISGIFDLMDRVEERRKKDLEKMQDDGWEIDFAAMQRQWKEEAELDKLKTTMRYNWMGETILESIKGLFKKKPDPMLYFLTASFNQKPIPMKKKETK